MKKLFLATIFSLAMVGGAAAGDATLKKGSKTIKLWCNNGGCYVADKVSTFRTKNRRKLGPGGGSNFRAHLASYKRKGWK